MRNRSQTYSERSARGIKLFAALLIVSAVIVVIWRLLLPQIEMRRYPIRYSSEVAVSASEFGLPEELVYAVILTESSFREDAVSHAGAKGLMQLTDDANDWAAFILREDSEPERIFEPGQNIRRGCCLLSYLIKEFGSTETALAAYNAGIGRVRGWLGDADYSSDGTTLHTIPIRETREYVKKVASACEKYRELYFN